MRITLIHPPDGMLPTLPYASLPALTACLRKAGHEVTIRDVNLDLVPRIFDSDRLAGWYAEVQAEADRLSAQPELSESERTELWRLQRLLAIPNSMFPEVEESLKVMKDRERFLDPPTFNRAFDVLRTAHRFAMNISPASFSEPHHSPAHVLDIQPGTLPDPPVEFFGEVADSILAEKPDLVAVTLPWDSSIFYGLKIMRLIKARSPDTPIVIGGAGIDSFLLPVTKEPEYFAAFDYAMVGECELEFPKLVDALENGTDPTVAKNLHYLEPDGTIAHTGLVMVDDLNVAPTPDFTNLDLDRYLLPDPVATFQTSRGCYYGKCTFCSEMFRMNFRMRRPDLVVDDMVKIHESTGITHFQIWDSLAPPKTLKHVAQEIIKRGLDFKWMAETKFEKPYLNEKTIETMAKGGCVFLFFGFESGSSRVLDLIDKGNDLEDVDKILDNLRRHGIRACTSWFMGFPGETEMEADTTYDFVAQRRDRILFSNYTRKFDIGTDTIVYEQQDRFGVEVFTKPDGALDYRYKDGSAHWEQDEKDESFHVRGDFHQVKNHIEVHYSKVDIKIAQQVTGQVRMGPLLRHINLDYIDEVRFQVTPECIVTNFARHPLRDDVEPGSYGLAYNTITGHVFEVTSEVRAFHQALQESRTFAELVGMLGEEPEAVRQLLEMAVNRGLVRIHCEAHHLDYRPEAELSPALQA
ncbi:MAG: hypothetical protein DHS20C15_15750 [Planctomycetota bacterium]|nr:MAG: hypothetical protein DHS20C15_15750 [Planctomycetota bacterium]